MSLCLHQVMCVSICERTSCRGHPIYQKVNNSLKNSRHHILLTSTDDALMGFPSILASKLRLLTEGSNTERTS